MKIKKYVGLIAAGLLGITIIVALILPKEEKIVTVGDEEVVEWTEERLYKEEVIEYSLVDQGMLEFDEGLATFVGDNLDSQGLYSHQSDDYTYIMISVGKNAVNKGIQLYDVRSNDQTLFVGYTFFENEQPTEVADEEDIPYMLIRLDRSEKDVEGRLIAEESE